MSFQPDSGSNGPLPTNRLTQFFNESHEGRFEQNLLSLPKADNKARAADDLCQEIVSQSSNNREVFKRHIQTVIDTISGESSAAVVLPLLISLGSLAGEELDKTTHSLPEDLPAVLSGLLFHPETLVRNTTASVIGKLGYGGLEVEVPLAISQLKDHDGNGNNPDLTQSYEDASGNLGVRSTTSHIDELVSENLKGWDSSTTLLADFPRIETENNTDWIIQHFDIALRPEVYANPDSQQAFIDDLRGRALGRVLNRSKDYDEQESNLVLSLSAGLLELRGARGGIWKTTLLKELSTFKVPCGSLAKRIATAWKDVDDGEHIPNIQLETALYVSKESPSPEILQRALFELHSHTPGIQKKILGVLKTVGSNLGDENHIFSLFIAEEVGRLLLEPKNGRDAEVVEIGFNVLAVLSRKSRKPLSVVSEILNSDRLYDCVYERCFLAIRNMDHSRSFRDSLRIYGQLKNYILNDANPPALRKAARVAHFLLGDQILS